MSETTDTRGIASDGARTCLSALESVFMAGRTPANSGDVERGITLLNELADLLRELRL
jgi:hypothetical protein